MPIRNDSNPILTHIWRGIPITEYIFNLMNGKSCEEYAAMILGSDEYALTATLIKCRRFTPRDVAKFTGVSLYKTMLYSTLIHKGDSI